MTVQKTLQGSALSAALLGLLATPLSLQAAEGAMAAEPSYTISANVGVFSQYVFRGISYTQEKPAVQGGFDLAHESGLYIGIWGTNVSDLALSNATGEIDVYGGYANTVGD
ncbi:MAG: TorF family putative porin, partial [Gammaproteobacteria bacterium]|nr:TorF family putative porin [Gammaproteobacteria bacterium]